MPISVSVITRGHGRPVAPPAQGASRILTVWCIGRTWWAVAGAALLGASCAQAPSPPTVEEIITGASEVLRRPDPEGWQHREAVDALASLQHPKAIDALSSVIEAEENKYEFFLRRMAARGLGKIAEAKAAAVLARNLTRAEGALRLEEDCAAALTELGTLAIPALTSRLAAEPDAAAAAARVLATIRDPAARAALEAAKPNASGRTRRAIEDALAEGAEIWEKGAPDSGVKK